MENLSSLVEQKALVLLESYSGANNHILYLKTKKETSKKFYPTRTQSDYIINYFDTVPKVARKWVDLDTYFAKKFAEERYLMEIPEKIYIEKLLVEKEKSYHIWGKFFEKDPLTEFWVPKSALIKSHNVEVVDVDYSKYSHRPPLQHQKEAIEKLAGSRRFILADDMGLGKTTCTIIAALETGAKKILIICPASLKINWQREIENYSDRLVFISEGKKFSTESDFVIVNYDILKNFHDTKEKDNSLLNQSNFDLVILDEAHMISNPQAQRTKIINHFVKNIKRVWLLTGTPMTSRPMNYYNLLNIIESPVAQNWMAYAIRYCQGYQFMAGRRKVWNVTGASNLEELRDRTSKQILRRLKEDVLDLPDKIISPVYLRLKSKEYEELMGEYYDWFDKNPDEASSLTVQFSKLMKVRKVISNEKTKQTIEIVENIIEQGKKVIVFTNFTESLQTIYSHFEKQAVQSFKVLDAYVSHGGNFLDTADNYSQWKEGNTGGESETIIGKWMKARGNRDKIILATKVAKLSTRRGLSPENIKAALNDSLSRLQTDYVDIYYSHEDDLVVPTIDTLATYTELIKEGKIRYIAASQHKADRFEQALLTSKQNNLASYIALQDHYNLMVRDPFESEQAQIVMKHNLSALPFYGLAKGFLTGKYRGVNTVNSVRSISASEYLDQVGLSTLTVLDEIAREHKAAVAAIALAWLRSNNAISTPIASARTVEQLDEIIQIVNLSKEQVDRLNIASKR